MPQVRIRNVSKEYKLVAGVFSPDLLKVEEKLGKRDPIDMYQHIAEKDDKAKSVFGSYQRKQRTASE